MRKSLLLCGLCGLIAGVPGTAAVSAPLLSNHLPGQAQPMLSLAATHCWWRAGRRHCSERITGYHSRCSLVIVYLYSALADEDHGNARNRCVERCGDDEKARDVDRYTQDVEIQCAAYRP